MRKLICKIFGCNWIYSFSPSDIYSKRVDVRTCKCCGKIQQYKQFSTLRKEPEFTWMTMITYTKTGAKNYWNLKLTNQNVKKG